MPRTRETFVFILASLLLSFAIFGDAMLGRSITAPVDIAPALWERYKYMDPGSNGIPENQTIVDQLSYDLPLQWTIYHAYRRGEIPWWDPYTYCGRPLLADSHVNGLDPVRVLIFLAVPDFVTAYNWTLVAHHLVLGAGLFLLLRHLGAGPATAGGLALAGQFAGGFTLFIGHPWITAALSWYPWLWWAWSAWWMRSSRVAAPAAIVFAAAIFYSGNLQSHLYLPYFGMCLIAGLGGRNMAQWLRATGMVALTGIGGALLAAPALGPTMELYFLNERAIRDFPPIMDGLLILSAVWPWSLGTFRTINYESMGFYLYAGPLITVFALLGLRGRSEETAAQAGARRVAIWILAAMIVLLCTPLHEVLYRRICGLGVIALLVLSTNGIQRLVAFSAGQQRKLGLILAGCGALVLLGTLAVVHVIYPRIRGRMESVLVERGRQDPYEGRSIPLRHFQAANYPNEVGIRNPEVAVALAAVGLLAAATWMGRTHALLVLLLGANLASPALFARRFIPRQSLTLFEHMKNGGEEQQAVAKQVGHGRLLEKMRTSTANFSLVFPLGTAQWTKTHVLHGYAALQPSSQTYHPDPESSKVADWEYDIPEPGGPGKWTSLNPGQSARFHWVGGEERKIQITGETLNRLTITFPPGGPRDLLRTDTYFPGWTATASNGARLPVRREGVMSMVTVPEGATSLTFHYSPAWFRACVVAFFAGVALLVGTSIRFPVTARNPQLPSRPAQ